MVINNAMWPLRGWVAVFFFFFFFWCVSIGGDCPPFFWIALVVSAIVPIIETDTPCLYAISHQAAAAAAAGGSSEPAVDESNLDASQYFDYRMGMVNEMKESGNPYPHKFEVTVSIPEFVATYKDSFENGEKADTVVSIAGRIYNKRAAGKKLVFYGSCRSLACPGAHPPSLLWFRVARRSMGVSCMVSFFFPC